MHEDGGVEKKRHENLWTRSTAQFDLLKGLAVAVQMTHKHVIYVPALDVTQYMTRRVIILANDGECIT